jgi:hypothetical protein
MLGEFVPEGFVHLETMGLDGRVTRAEVTYHGDVDLHPILTNFRREASRFGQGGAWLFRESPDVLCKFRPINELQLFSCDEGHGRTVTDLEVLEQMFAGGVPSSLIHDGMRGEIGEPVVGIVSVIKVELSTRTVRVEVRVAMRHRRVVTGTVDGTVDGRTVDGGTWMAWQAMASQCMWTRGHRGRCMMADHLSGGSVDWNGAVPNV